MEIKKYRFGPVVFAVQSEIPIHRDQKYEAFRTDDSTDADFTIEICPLPEDSPCGIREPIRSEHCGNRILAAMNRSVIPNVTIGRLMYLLNACSLFPEKDSFILHASYVVRDGKALLFSAPSGTGKSTQAEFWHTRRGCDIINGHIVSL